jgi:peptidoglycan/xylan/chitin deacetylase (PgdA/CDA1 family)
VTELSPRQSLQAHADAFARGHFVRVVNWHNTPESAAPALRRQLADLAREFAPVSLADLDRFYETGRWDLPRPGLLPVFYEGYRNNAEVVAPILDDLGLTGWFFICTGFLDTPPDLQEAYCRAHHIGLVPEDVDGRPIAMTWDQVRELSVRHVVNPHTANHESVGWIRGDSDVEREIIDPKRRMDAVTGQSAACFAWLEGTHHGHDPVNDSGVRRAGYRYVFSNTMIQRLA